MHKSRLYNMLNPISLRDSYEVSRGELVELVLHSAMVQLDKSI